MTKKQSIESREYKNDFARLSPQDKRAVLDMLDFFFEQLDHHSLREHTLYGQAERVRSLSVRDDLRVLIQKRQDGGILLVRVGDHKTIYNNL